MVLSVSLIPIGLIVGIQGFNSSLLFLTIILGVTFVFSFLISYIITRPIIKITKNLDSISKGQLDVQLEKSEIYEINNLTESLDRIMASLKLAILKVGIKRGEIFEDNITATETAENKQENPYPNYPNILNKPKKSKLVVANSKDNDKSEKKWSEREFDSVFIFDKNANILDCNENICKRLGYSKNEMLSLNMVDFDALESKQELSERINLAKKNGSYSFKTIHKRKNGSAILVYENLQYNKNKNTFKCVVREDYSHKK